MGCDAANSLASHPVRTNCLCLQHSNGFDALCEGRPRDCNANLNLDSSVHQYLTIDVLHPLALLPMSLLSSWLSDCVVTLTTAGWVGTLPVLPT